MWIRHRSLQREYMDDHELPQVDADEVFRFLAGINRWLGGTRATLQRFSEFRRGWQPRQRIRVLDVAAGGGDVAAALVSWGRRRDVEIQVTVFDVSPGALVSARRRLARAALDARVDLVRGDVRRMPFRDRAFDYVICALFAHHLTDDDLVETLRRFDALAAHGIVVNDLVRRWRLYAWTWLFTRPFNPILRQDGLLSVKRALQPGELAALAHRAGLDWLTVRQHFGHRMTLAGERPAGA